MGLAALAAAAGLIGCGGGGGAPLPSAPAKLGIASPAFADGATIPTRFTCSGANLSPPLRFSGVPAKARALALLVQDPDANDYVHWAVFHIPPRTTGFEEGRPGWKGPCPPKGDKPHHYVFALYALDASVDSSAAVAEHALARGTLTGRFGR